MKKKTKQDLKLSAGIIGGTATGMAVGSMTGFPVGTFIGGQAGCLAGVAWAGKRKGKKNKYMAWK